MAAEGVPQPMGKEGATSLPHSTWGEKSLCLHDPWTLDRTYHIMQARFSVSPGILHFGLGFPGLTIHTHVFASRRQSSPGMCLQGNAAAIPADKHRPLWRVGLGLPRPKQPDRRAGAVHTSLPDLHWTVSVLPPSHILSAQGQTIQVCVGSIYHHCACTLIYLLYVSLVGSTPGSNASHSFLSGSILVFIIIVERQQHRDGSSQIIV